ncbi:MAG TPA: PadR family transcriptional regulator [Candidatus Desulfaltia sp.]|nr:PadR family transcriptional regulator [Candidatus Desulfaltia sp.]
MAEKKLTTLEYGLLGLVGMSPLTGYDVHKVFSTTPFGHFSSSPGAIYPALRRLAHIGLLEARLDTAKEARPRRIYSLTDSGEEALEAWLHQPVTREELIRGAGAPILRFALSAGRLTRDETLAYLETYQKVVAVYIEELYGYTEQTTSPENLYGSLALYHGIRSFESELEWTKWAATEIRRAGRSSRKPRPSR